MKWWQRLNGPMLIGAGIGLVQIAFLLIWIRDVEIDSTDKMFAVIIICSTIGVMFWFYGDNASREQVQQAWRAEMRSEMAAIKAEVAEARAELADVKATAAATQAEVADLKIAAAEIQAGIARITKLLEEQTRERPHGRQRPGRQRHGRRSSAEGNEADVIQLPGPETMRAASRLASRVIKKSGAGDNTGDTT